MLPIFTKSKQNTSMRTIFKLSALIVLMSLWACGGSSEQSATEAKEGTAQEETSQGGVSTQEDERLSRTIVGKWAYESGEISDELDGLMLDFNVPEQFSAVGGMFSAEGTYSVKGGKLIIKAKVLTGEEPAGREFTKTFTIVNVSEEAVEINGVLTYSLSLKNDKGAVLVYNLVESYGD